MRIVQPASIPEGTARAPYGDRFGDTSRQHLLAKAVFAFIRKRFPRRDVSSGVNTNEHSGNRALTKLQDGSVDAFPRLRVRWPSVLDLDANER